MVQRPLSSLVDPHLLLGTTMGNIIIHNTHDWYEAYSVKKKNATREEPTDTIRQNTPLLYDWK